MFFSCHVSHVHPVKIDAERITRNDREITNSLSYDGIEFPVREKIFLPRLKLKTVFPLISFVMKIS